MDVKTKMRWVNVPVDALYKALKMDRCSKVECESEEFTEDDGYRF